MMWSAVQTLVAVSAVGFPACAAYIAVLQKNIANQQMVIARSKLNHDLFERRFLVYVAVYDYMVACLNREGGTPSDSRTFYEATRCAPFLFDKETNEFLLKLWKESIQLQVLGPQRSHPITQEALIEYNNRCNQATDWINREFENIVPRFQKVLDLSNILPFSIQHAPSLDDANRLRRQINTP